MRKIITVMNLGGYITRSIMEDKKVDINGIKRLVLKCNTGYLVKDISFKITEKGVVDGLLSELKEIYIEDFPIIGTVYKMGKNDGDISGKMDGYNRASEKYVEIISDLQKQDEEKQENLKKILEDIKKNN